MATEKKEPSWLGDSITVSTSTAIDTIDLSSVNMNWNIHAPALDAIDLTDFTLSGIPTWTSGTNTIAGSGGAGVNFGASTINPSNKITLTGPDADVEINGESLMTMLAVFKERLGWLQPNPELEQDWNELRELGDQYRALEKKCQEKIAMWDKLKSMPPPQID